MQSEQINELAAALAKAQGAMKNAVMNRINPHFKSKYADLAAVLDAMREPLSTNGLAVSQSTEIREGGLVLRTVLMHATGQWMDSEYPLPAVARPQEMGSALTYARRYSLAALVCNSADEDDDANAAEEKKQTISAAGRKPKPPAPNVMVDSATGEITESAAVADGPLPDEPTHTHAPAAPGAALSLEDMAREAAMRGEKVFKTWFKGRTKTEQKALTSIGEELRGLMATSEGD